MALMSFVSVCVAGCGSDGLQLVPVEGTVMLDGKPLEGASILFQPDAGGRPATGVSDANGKFTLTTMEPGDGAQVGMNKVSVAKEQVVASKRKLEEGEFEPIKFLTPVKYASPNTSGLTVNVKEDMPPVELKLTK